MFPFISYKQIESYLPEIEREKVSQVARSQNGFLSIYKQYGVNMPNDWKIKRENFIKRHLVQYEKNPTHRRKLALIVWAYDPKF